MLLLSRSSCCVSHSCSRLPDLTHAGPCRGQGFLLGSPLAQQKQGALGAHVSWPPEPCREGPAERKGRLVPLVCCATWELAARCSAAPQVFAGSHQVEQVLRVAGRPETLLTM